MAPREQAHVDLVVSNQDALRTAQALESMLARMHAKATAGNKRVGQSAKSVGSEFQRWGQNLAGTLIGIRGIERVLQTVMAQARREFAFIEERQKRAAESGLTLGQTILEIAPIFDKSSADFKEALAIAKTSPGGFAPSDVLRAQAAAISAAGTPEGAGERVRGAEEILRLRPELRGRPDEVNAEIAAVMQMIENFKKAGLTVSVADVMETREQVVRAAPTIDRAKVGPETAKTLAGITGITEAMGVTVAPEFGMSLMTAIATRSGDVDLTQSSTTAIKITRQLLEEFSKEFAKSGGTLQGKRLEDLFQQVSEGSTEEGKAVRKRLLGFFDNQLTPEERKEFAKKGGDAKIEARARTFGATLELINSQLTETWRLLRESGITSPTGGGARFKARREVLMELPEVQAEVLAGRSESARQQERARDPSRALAAQIVEQITESLKDLEKHGTLSPELQQRATAFVLRAQALAAEGKDPSEVLEDAAETLQYQADVAAGTERGLLEKFFALTDVLFVSGGRLIADRQRLLGEQPVPELLQRQIDILKEMAESQREQAATQAREVERQRA